MSQTEDLAPADRLLYALRDVTGTVESIPLITASILSKKAAEGSDGFVFDVKAGSGAFMKTGNDARALAEALVKTARLLGKKALAVVTAMDEPLGRFVGNALEVGETVACLQGDMSADVGEVTFRLAARMLMLAGIARSVEEGIAVCRRALDDGSAYRLFLKNVAAQGGDPQWAADAGRLALAPRREEAAAGTTGYVGLIDAYKIGLASVLLGAGRATKASPILPRAGIELVKKRGDPVERGEPLCRLYFEAGTVAAEAIEMSRSAYVILDEPPRARPLILYETEES